MKMKRTVENGVNIIMWIVGIIILLGLLGVAAHHGGLFCTGACPNG